MNVSKVIPIFLLASVLVACGGGTGASLAGYTTGTDTSTNTGTGSGTSTGTGTTGSGSTTNEGTSGTGSNTGGSGSTGTDNTSSNVRQLARNALDADYSDSLERLITVGSSPDNALSIINPTTGEQQAVPLNLAPTSLALSPDGKMAVVGHEGGVTYINLQTATVQDFYDTIGFKVFDIVLDAAGMAYATPTDNLHWSPLQTINLSTGQVQTATQVYGLAGSYLQLAASQNAVYVLYKGAVVDLEKIDISVVPPTGLYDSPYNGDHDMGGADAKGFWMTEDQAYLLTAGETLFRTATTQDQDMLFQRSLADADGDYTTALVHADHSQETGKFVVILDKGITGVSSDYSVKTYTMPTLTLAETKSSSDLNPTTSTDPVTPQFVFFNSDGTKRYAILKQGTGTYLMAF